MAKAKINQKAARVFKFILGGRHPVVYQALAQYGFTDAERRKGLSLLGAVTRAKQDVRVPKRDQSVTQLIDDAENVWYPIAKAALKHHYPEAYDYVFHNLGQMSGPTVALTASTFFARIRELGTGATSAGDVGVQARALLERRGLTDQVLANTEALIAELGETKDEPSTFATQEELQEAEDAMWAWYLDWSAVARVAVKDRRALRSLGFLSNSKKNADEELDDAGIEADGYEVESIDYDPTEPDGVSSPRLQSSNGTLRELGNGVEVPALN